MIDNEILMIMTFLIGPLHIRKAPSVDIVSPSKNTHAASSIHLLSMYQGLLAQKLMNLRSNNSVFNGYNLIFYDLIQ